MYPRDITAGPHPESLAVLDRGDPIELTARDVTKYHGTGSPGGVALAFKAMQRGLPLLEPEGTPERREVAVHTPFDGPGARDAFELVLRAVTGDRYAVDPSLERTDLPPTRARFVFRLSYRDRVVTLTLREGFVDPEFMDLLGAERTAEQDARLTELKRELADRVMAASAPAAYEAVEAGPARG